MLLPLRELLRVSEKVSSRLRQRPAPQVPQRALVGRCLKVLVQLPGLATLLLLVPPSSKVLAQLQVPVLPQRSAQPLQRPLVTLRGLARLKRLRLAGV